MRLWLLLLATFSQAMSQLLSDAGELSVESFDTALLNDQGVNWPTLPLAWHDSPGYLASQPDSTPQSNPLQQIPQPADSDSSTPGSDTDLTTAGGCVSPSPQTNPPARTKRKLLRGRQNVQNACPAPTPSTGSTSGSATGKTSQNPRLYPGGAKRRVSDWFFGTPQDWKQCPPEKKTLCCIGAQEGSKVRTCTTFYLFPGSLTTSVNCLSGGIYCCDDLVISDRVINYHEDIAIFDRDGQNCFPLFYRPP